MAEFVQYEIERTIQDLEVLEKFGIFEKDEIRSVIKKRKDFEYRVRKVNKTKDDFLRYITYEESLLKLIRIRKEKQGLTTDKNLIEKPIHDHILRLFELCLLKFQSDISIWLSYLNFSLSQKAYPHVTKIFFRMLQIHNKDFLWIKFAKFEFETKNSSECARKIFLKAINFHPQSQTLWLEYFRFEMLYCSKIRRRFSILSGHENEESDKKKSRDNVWDGQLALIVFEHALKTHYSFEFAEKFLTISSKFDYDLAMTVKNKIILEIRKFFGESEVFWNLLAREEIIKYEMSVKWNENKNNEQQIQLKKQAIEDSLKIFEKACTIYDNTQMWAFQLNFRFELIFEHKITNKRFIAELLFNCERLWKDKKLDRIVFQKWIQLYAKVFENDDNSVKKLYNFCLEASEKWSNDLELHLFIGCILVTVTKLKKTNIQDFFEESLTIKFIKLPSTDLNENEQVNILIEFWELYIDYLLSHECDLKTFNRVIDKLFKTFNFVPRKMGIQFKTEILQLVFQMFGIEKARIFFQERKNQTPITKEFFMKMLKLEENETLPICKENILSIYSDLVHHFGTTEPDIWQQYIQFAIKNRLTQQIGSIYDKAIKSLNSNVVSRFVQDYALSQTSGVSAINAV